MRIVMISKACVVGMYQRKLEEMACLPGVDLTVIVPPSWRDPSGEVRLERAYTRGYRLLIEPIRLNGNFHLYHFPTLGQRLREIQPDIVHIDEEPYNLATWHALWLARRIGAKSLFFSWQNILRQYPFPFSRGERWVLDTVDYAIVGTDSAADIWRAKCYHGSMAVIPQFGVDPQLFQPALPAATATSRPFQIGYIGRLVPEKGVDLLLRALATFSTPWQIQIIGQGPERDRLQQLARDLNIAECVNFVGQVASTAMPAFYQQLDVLAIPSLTRPNWKEQFGRVIVEAMASAIPVIGSDSGAIPGVIGDGGLTFPEGDVVALTDRLRTLMIDAALRQRLAGAGRARVLAAYTHAQVAKQTVEVYWAMLRHGA